MNSILLLTADFAQKQILKATELIKKCNLNTLSEKALYKIFQDMTFKITIQPDSEWLGLTKTKKDCKFTASYYQVSWL